MPEPGGASQGKITGSPMTTDDQEIIARYLRGEPEAVGTVEKWISGAACHYQRQLADHWDDILQDARQEVARLLEKGNFHGESSLRTYLWRVVTHACLDHIRTLSRWTGTDLEDQEREEGDQSPVGIKPEPKTEPAPAEEAVQRFKAVQSRLAADTRPFRDLPPEEKKERLRLIQGIGRGLFSTSEELKQQKQEEIDLEERHRAH
jgi:hypothetical protein